MAKFVLRETPEHTWDVTKDSRLYMYDAPSIDYFLDNERPGKKDEVYAEDLDGHFDRVR